MGRNYASIWLILTSPAVPRIVAMGADGPGATPPVYTTESSQIPSLGATAAAGGTENESSDLSSDAEGEGDSSLPSSATSSPLALWIRAGSRVGEEAAAYAVQAYQAFVEGLRRGRVIGAADSICRRRRE